MHSIWIAVFSVLAFVLAYRCYSKFVAQKIYKLDPNYQTPAHQFRDNIDFVPTNKYVLWGHHFTSIAGASPILGPAIAVYWGWLPACLWVVFGTIFIAGVHDFGALAISIRNQGQSIGTLAGKYIGKRAKILFLFIILLLLLMINAVFAWIISNLFITFPSSVLSIFIQIPLAVWIGNRIYSRRGNLLLSSLVVLLIMYLVAILSSQIPALQIDLVSYFNKLPNEHLFGLNPVSLAFCTWIILLMVYVYFASTLPVWKLLQPRDYINSHQLVVGLFILYLGLIISNPVITTPILNSQASGPSWFPLLFITIACGAVSGFHSLVASGTTSKQIDKETDARFVAYSSAVGEGALALISIIAVITFFGSSSEFNAVYSSFTEASSNGLGTFVRGAAQLAHGIGVPLDIGQTIASLIVISFAATTLDSSVRLMRYIINELGVTYRINTLTKTHVATSIAVVSSALLVFLPQGPQGFGSGGYLIWPLFGTSNQLLAGISLLVISIWLKKKKRNFLISFIPMLFLLFMTLWALTQSVLTWSGLVGNQANLLLTFLGGIVLCLSFWILIEAMLMFKKTQPEQTQAKIPS